VRWHAPEFVIFLFGLAAWGLILFWVLSLAHYEPQKSRALLSVVAVHLTAGRAMGVSMALSLHFSRGEAILLAVLIEAGVVCTFFSAFSFSARRFIRLPWLDDAFDNVRRTAAEHRSRLIRWGIPGLFLFVWFPFFMTGPVVGSVIGFLLGLHPYLNVSVVLAGTCTAIIFWTFAIGPIVEWTARIGQIIPMMIVIILCVFVAALRLRRHAQVRRSAPPAAQTDGTDAGH